MASRTFSDFETISEAMNGICQLYETRLKGLNPGTSYFCFRSKVDEIVPRTQDVNLKIVDERHPPALRDTSSVL